MISLCIPVYNMLKEVKNLIPNLMKFKKSLEIIILDNNSNDGTYEYLKQYRHIFKIRKNKKNLGLNGSIRRLINLSTQKYITFIGADDEIISSKNLINCASWGNKNKISIIFTPFYYCNYKKKKIIGQNYVNKIIKDYNKNSPIENYWMDNPNLGSIGSWIFKKKDVTDFDYSKLSKKSLCFEYHFAAHIYKKKKFVGFYPKKFYKQTLSSEINQLANLQYKNLDNFKELLQLIIKNKNKVYFKKLCNQYKIKLLSNLVSLIVFNTGKQKIYKFIKAKKIFLNITSIDFFYIFLIFLIPKKILKILLYQYRSI